jgi:hypothetical protein
MIQFLSPVKKLVMMNMEELKHKELQIVFLFFCR